jgi:hypothetical protein
MKSGQTFRDSVAVNQLLLCKSPISDGISFLSFAGEKLGVISAERVLVIDGVGLGLRDTLKVVRALPVVLCVEDAVMEAVLDVVGIPVAVSKLLPVPELDHVMLDVQESVVVGILDDVTGA